MTDEIIFDTEEKLISLFQPDMLLSHQYFVTSPETAQTKKSED
jgi:hypothetical protein